MTKTNDEKGYKKFILFVAGLFVLVLGITLVLFWWKNVVVLFQGAIGIILALAGLFAVYAAGKDW